jgi:hypothetical protein
LHIDISVIGNEREGDLYAGRFIWYRKIYTNK